MSMGWYLIPLSSMASSRAPTTNRASCLSVHTKTDRGRERERPCWCRCSRQRGNVGVGERRLTSVGVGELGAAEEAQVARPGPGSLGVSKTESGVEVVGLENLLAVTAVVTAAVMSAVHPDLQESPDNLLFSIYRVEITNPLHVQIPK